MAFVRSRWCGRVLALAGGIGAMCCSCGPRTSSAPGGLDAARGFDAGLDASLDVRAELDTGVVPACAPFAFDEIEATQVLGELAGTARLPIEGVELCAAFAAADTLVGLEVDVSAHVAAEGAGLYEWNGRTYPATVIWRSEPADLDDHGMMQSNAAVSMLGIGLLGAADGARRAGENARADRWVDAAIRLAVQVDAWAQTSRVNLGGRSFGRRQYPVSVDYDVDDDLVLDDVGVPTRISDPNDAALIRVASFFSLLGDATTDERWANAARGVVVDAIARLRPYGGGAALAYFPEGGNASGALCNGTTQVMVMIAKALGEDELVAPLGLSIPLEAPEAAALRDEVLPRLVRFFDLAAEREELEAGDGCSWMQTERSSGTGGLANSRSVTWGGGSSGIAAALMAAHEILGDEDSTSLAACAARWVPSRAIDDEHFGGKRWLTLERPCPACSSEEANELIDGSDVSVDGETVEVGRSLTGHCRGAATILAMLGQVAPRLAAGDPELADELRTTVQDGLAWILGVSRALSADDEGGGYLLPYANIVAREPQLGTAPSGAEHLEIVERYLAGECEAGHADACASLEVARDLWRGILERLVWELRCQDSRDGRLATQGRARLADCSPIDFPYQTP